MIRDLLPRVYTATEKYFGDDLRSFFQCPKTILYSR
jgi:hypothetical protein